MRKQQLLMLGLLAASALTAVAENIVIVQGSYLNTGSSTQAELADVKVEAAGR